MEMSNDINRFKTIQGNPYTGYAQALKEITKGKKISHWIWYIFPQLRGLGQSSRSTYYGLSGREEAMLYLHDEQLGARLREITEVLLSHTGRPAISILGEIDALKVQSCMTLFDSLSPGDVFSKVLDAFYEGKRCMHTLYLLQKENKTP